MLRKINWVETLFNSAFCLLLPALFQLPVNYSSLNTSVEKSGATEDNSLELKAQTKLKLINLTQDFALTSCILYQGRLIC